jgi:hypothetical protein
MSTFLYLAIEGRRRGSTGRWRFMRRMESPGTTRQIHGLLGLDAGSATPASLLALRGIPADADDETLAEDAYFVDDAIAETSAGECVDARFCSSADANEWAGSGRARRLAADRVTSPDAFGHSWATADDLARVLQFAEGDSGAVEALAEILTTMRYLEEADIEVRAIYWYE